MKRVYESPMMFVEEFAANEYVAACGDTNYEYWFKCDAMGGITGTLFTSDGDNKFEPGFGDEYFGSGYRACGEKHLTTEGDKYTEAWYVTGWEALDGGHIAKKVLIWKGVNGDNIHCTTELDKKEWETAKS